MTDQRKRERPDNYFSDWKEREALAEAMIPQVGALAREQNVKCYIYGRSLVNQSVLKVECDPVVGCRVGLVGGAYGVVDLPSEVRLLHAMKAGEVLT